MMIEKLLSAALLMVATSQVFAQAAPLPEPETYALLGIGVAAMFLSRKKRK